MPLVFLIVFGWLAWVFLKGKAQADGWKPSPPTTPPPDADYPVPEAMSDETRKYLERLSKPVKWMDEFPVAGLDAIEKPLAPIRPSEG